MKVYEIHVERHIFNKFIHGKLSYIVRPVIGKFSFTTDDILILVETESGIDESTGRYMFVRVTDVYTDPDVTQNGCNISIISFIPCDLVNTSCCIIYYDKDVHSSN